MICHYGGSQPLRSPKGPGCWYSHSCMVPSHMGSGLTYVNNRLLQKTQCVQCLKPGHKRYSSALVSQITCSRGANHLAMRILKRSHGEATGRETNISAMWASPLRGRSSWVSQLLATLWDPEADKQLSHFQIRHPKKLWDTIHDYCCSKPLNFGVVYYAAVGNYYKKLLII